MEKNQICTQFFLHCVRTEGLEKNLISLYFLFFCFLCHTTKNVSTLNYSSTLGNSASEFTTHGYQGTHKKSYQQRFMNPEVDKN